MICVLCRPTLVLDNEFNGIPAAMGVLQHWFEADAIDHMVQEQPLFLIEDVEDAISSLNRCCFFQHFFSQQKPIVGGQHDPWHMLVVMTAKGMLPDFAFILLELSVLTST